MSQQGISDDKSLLRARDVRRHPARTGAVARSVGLTWMSNRGNVDSWGNRMKPGRELIRSFGRHSKRKWSADLRYRFEATGGVPFPVRRGGVTCNPT
jgi:hypothetical protein